MPKDFRKIGLYPVLLEEQAFYQAIRAHLATNGPEGKVLVYVHGFNNGFAEEVYKLAVLVSTTGYRGIPILFDWPAVDIPMAKFWELRSGYLTDVKMITEPDAQQVNLSQRDLRLLLDALQQPPMGAQHISLLAHSLGNRLLLRTLDTMQTNGDFMRFDQLILAAPDIAIAPEKPDPGFAAMLNPLLDNHRVVRATVYGARNDKAMWVSYAVNGRWPRGYFGTPENADGFDQMIVTAINEGALGHDYFVTNPEVVLDIAALLNHWVMPPRGKMAREGMLYSVFTFQK